jgi:hypothetical protein
VESGCSTNIVLGGVDVGSKISKTVVPIHLKEDEYMLWGIKFEKKTSLHYIVNGRDVKPIGTKALFGAGNSQDISGSVWNYISSQLVDLNESDICNKVKDILSDLTVNAANAVGLFAGYIDSGLPADIILFKKQAEWDCSSTESLLKALFLHQGNESKVAATFKQGILVYASDDFSNFLKQKTLEKYYSSPNVAPNDVSEKYEFDSIEEALEDFSTFLI